MNTLISKLLGTAVGVKIGNDTIKRQFVFAVLRDTNKSSHYKTGQRNTKNPS